MLNEETCRRLTRRMRRAFPWAPVPAVSYTLEGGYAVGPVTLGPTRDAAEATLKRTGRWFAW